jgi:hypothetical protein
MPSLADSRWSDPRDIKTCINDILDYGNDVFDSDTQRLDLNDDGHVEDGTENDDVGSFGIPPFPRLFPIRRCKLSYSPSFFFPTFVTHNTLLITSHHLQLRHTIAITSQSSREHVLSSSEFLSVCGPCDDKLVKAEPMKRSTVDPKS